MKSHYAKVHPEKSVFLCDSPTNIFARLFTPSPSLKIDLKPVCQQGLLETTEEGAWMIRSLTDEETFVIPDGAYAFVLRQDQQLHLSLETKKAFSFQEDGYLSYSPILFAGIVEFDFDDELTAYIKQWYASSTEYEVSGFDPQSVIDFGFPEAAFCSHSIVNRP